jgi:hypothetical protein
MRVQVVTTNICGSDQHMVRGRTSLPGGHMVLGHEITGEVVECGSDVEFINKGDLVRCRLKTQTPLPLIAMLRVPSFLCCVLHVAMQHICYLLL